MKARPWSVLRSRRAGPRWRVLLRLGAGAIFFALLVRGFTSPSMRDWRLERASLADLERLARTQASDERLLYWLGRKRAAAEQLDAAETAYRQAVGMRSDDIPAWVGLGEVLRRLGRNAEAYGVLKMASGREPRAADASASLALIEAQRGAIPQALAEARHAIQVAPRCAAAWYAFGVIEQRLDQPGRVIQSLQSAIRWDPAEARYQQLLGEALRDMGQLAAAERPLRRALALARNYPPTHLSLGELYAARPPASTYLPLAVRELQCARDLAPNNWAPHYHLGRAYLRQQCFAAAAAEFARVLTLAPDYDPVLLDLSRAYAGMGRRALARRLLASFEMASENYQRVQATRLRLAREPENAALHFELARLYLDRGRRRAAYAELQAGLSRDPRSSWAREMLRRLLQPPASTGR